LSGGIHIRIRGVLNTPFFVLWLIDKVWQAYWRRCVSPEVHCIKLGENYMALFWNSPTCTLFNAVGPEYTLRLNDSSLLEGRHVFTAFHNRLGWKVDSKSDFKWCAGTIIKKFNKRRVPQLGEKDPHSHTKRMYDAETLDLTVWGPFQSEMSDHIKFALHGSVPVTLVAAGSGVGFVVDAIQYFVEYTPYCKLTVLFSTRSESLHSWVKHVIKEITSSLDHWKSNHKQCLH
jgi:hypothetical protein